MAVLVIIKDSEGQPVGQLLAGEKAFRTGSRGFFAQGKVVIEGRRYQAQVQLVEVGSKAAREGTSREA